jgi:hypothetical protein
MRRKRDEWQKQPYANIHQKYPLFRTNERTKGGKVLHLSYMNKKTSAQMNVRKVKDFRPEYSSVEQHR